MLRLMLNDSQWLLVEQLLPGKPYDPGRSAVNNRLFLEAVLWVARTGVPWRDLPPEFGRWNSVYKRFARLDSRGVWRDIFSALQRSGLPIEVFLDGTIVRAHQHSAGARKKTVLRRLVDHAAA
jgi:transposase